MTIILLHDWYEVEKLKVVKSQMLELGAPVIKAVWLPCYNAWQALEGCHRIRAAHQLGMAPIIDEVEYDAEKTASEIGIETRDEMTMEELIEGANWRESICFDDQHS